MRDWTPLVGYSTAGTIDPLDTVYLVLYPLPDYAGSDREFLIEDDEGSAIFLERVIGDITFAWSEDPGSAQSNVGWRLMPLGVDFSTLEVLEPFSAQPWDWGSSEWANLKWWDERVYREVDVAPAEGLIPYPDTVDIPHWTFVDCHPRQLLGAKRNLWPVLAMRNRNANARLFYRHRLRGFWK